MVLSIVLIIIWITFGYNGIYGLKHGYFPREQDKVKQHEPKAYRKWINISSVLIILCSLLNVLWSVLDMFTEGVDFIYIICIIATVVVVIAAVGISYAKIVKPADEKCGIESEFSKQLKDIKKNK